MSILVLLWLQCACLLAQPSVVEMSLPADVAEELGGKPKAQLEGILGEAYVFPAQDQGWLASVVVRLPNYPAKPDKGFLIAIAGYDNVGNRLDATRFELPGDSLNQPLMLYETLQSEKPIARLAWYVRNNDTNKVTVQEKRDLPTSGSLSNLLLTPGSAGAMVSLAQNREQDDQVRSNLDPLRMETGVFPIFPLNTFNAPDTLYFFFTLAKPREALDQVAVKLEIVTENDRFGAPLFEVAPQPSQHKNFTPFFGNFDTLGFDAGSYQAVLTVTLPDHEPLVQVQPFEIIWQ